MTTGVDVPDTAKWCAAELSREQMEYILSLLRWRVATISTDLPAGSDQHLDRMNTALGRVKAIEGVLHAYGHTDAGWTGLAHLEDYLSSVIDLLDAEHRWKDGRKE